MLHFLVFFVYVAVDFSLFFLAFRSILFCINICLQCSFGGVLVPLINLEVFFTYIDSLFMMQKV